MALAGIGITVRWSLSDKIALLLVFNLNMLLTVVRSFQAGSKKMQARQNWMQEIFDAEKRVLVLPFLQDLAYHL